MEGLSIGVSMGSPMGKSMGSGLGIRSSLVHSPSLCPYTCLSAQAEHPFPTVSAVPFSKKAHTGAYTSGQISGLLSSSQGSKSIIIIKNIYYK